ncbi:hypothetical protein SGRIM128S_08705 [Streptomyces griseomycini]
MLERVPPGRRALVVDNGSTDGSDRVARGVGATVVREERRGFGAACHAGLTAATAGTVCFCGCDASPDPAGLVLGRRRPRTRGARPALVAPAARGLGAALAWTWSLAPVAGWFRNVAGRLTTPHEYLRARTRSCPVRAPGSPGRPSSPCSSAACRSAAGERQAAGTDGQAARAGTVTAPEAAEAAGASGSSGAPERAGASEAGAKKACGGTVPATTPAKRSMAARSPLAAASRRAVSSGGGARVANWVVNSYISDTRASRAAA